MHYWYLLPVLVTYFLLVTLTSTRGSYKYITSALFAEYKLRTLRPTDTFLLIVPETPETVAARRRRGKRAGRGAGRKGGRPRENAVLLGLLCTPCMGKKGEFWMG